MTTILDRVNHEREAELARHQVVLEKYAEIERLAREIAELTGAPAATPPPAIEGVAVEEPRRELPPAKPEPTPAPAKRTRRRGEDVLEVTFAFVAEHPGCSVAEVREALGIKGCAASDRMRRLLAAGRVRAEGNTRARRYWASGGNGRIADGPQPEADHGTPAPAAPPEDDPAGVDISVPGLGSRVEDTAERRASAAAVERELGEDAETLLAVMKDLGPSTMADLQEKTDWRQARVRGLLLRLQKLNRVEAWGVRDGVQLWERVPLPAEREDIEIHNGGGRITDTQVLETLRHGGDLTLRELGRELDASAADVGLTVKALEDAGLVKRLPHGGKYRALEQKDVEVIFA